MLEMGVVMPNWMAKKVIVVPHWQIILEIYPLGCWRKPFMERCFAGSTRTQSYLSEVSEEAAGHCVLLTMIHCGSQALTSGWALKGADWVARVW